MQMSSRVVAIVGKRVSTDGKPSGELVERIRLGCECARRTMSKHVVFCGTPAEVDEMERLARQEYAHMFVGSAIRIVLMRESANTVEHAVFLRQFMRKHGLCILHLATSDYHEQRCFRVFSSIMHNKEFQIYFECVPCQRMLDPAVYRASVERELVLQSNLHRQLEQYARFSKNVYFMVSASWSDSRTRMEDPWACGADPPLDETGVSESHRLAEEVANVITRHFPLEQSFVVLSSPLRRSIQTVAALQSYCIAAPRVKPAPATAPATAGGGNTSKLPGARMTMMVELLPFLAERRLGIRDEMCSSLTELQSSAGNVVCVVCSCYGGQGEWIPHAARMAATTPESYVAETTSQTMLRVERFWGYVLTKAEAVIVACVNPLFFRHIVFGSFLPQMLSSSLSFTQRDVDKRQDLCEISPGSLYRLTALDQIAEEQKFSLFSSGRPDVVCLWPKAYPHLFHADASLRPCTAVYPVIPLSGFRDTPECSDILLDICRYAQRTLAASVFHSRFRFVPLDRVCVRLSDVPIRLQLETAEADQEAFRKSRYWTTFAFGHVSCAESVEQATLSLMNSDCMRALTSWLRLHYPNSDLASSRAASVSLRWAYALEPFLPDEIDAREAIRQDLQLYVDRKIGSVFTLGCPDVGIFHDAFSFHLYNNHARRASLMTISPTGQMDLFSIVNNTHIGKTFEMERASEFVGRTVSVGLPLPTECVYFALVCRGAQNQLHRLLCAYSPSSGACRAWIIASAYIILECRVLDEIGKGCMSFAQCDKGFVASNKFDSALWRFDVTLVQKRTRDSVLGIDHTVIDDFAWTVRLSRTSRRPIDALSSSCGCIALTCVRNTLFWMAAANTWKSLSFADDRMFERNPIMDVAVVAAADDASPSIPSSLSVDPIVVPFPVSASNDSEDALTHAWLVGRGECIRVSVGGSPSIISRTALFSGANRGRFTALLPPINSHALGLPGGDGPCVVGIGSHLGRARLAHIDLEQNFTCTDIDLALNDDASESFQWSFAFWFDPFPYGANALVSHLQ
eukprot:ANDGO_01452.mRNA.1 hypothetical protein